MRKSRLLCTLALAAAMPCLTGGIDRTSALDARLLAAHNRERAGLGVPVLGWDAGLAQDAKAWAAQLARSGQLAHASNTDSGENLWAGTSGRYAPEEMVGLWLAEKADFRPGIFPNVSKSRNLAAVGHYTQMVWRTTERVGCAIADNGREEFLVCRYARAGNVIGERPI
ncbi:CAP domain-containing protein [Sphingomonas sp.]|uniref:CAP domain-containing protein n=1 Tax=Sphingomonas sp. TaxID=28214 RepID=UPI002DBEC2F6|nr:CAP domain-containing protein [Sphingomonas sp.]HEU4969807.1 CAP domain-containing protein [Sphingomonas sp.]